MTTKNKYGQCLLCQLERGGKAYARQDHDLDVCSKHRTASDKHRNRGVSPIAYIDDGIDLDAEHPMRYDEQAEHDRIFNKH